MQKNWGESSPLKATKDILKFAIRTYGFHMLIISLTSVTAVALTGVAFAGWMFCTLFFVLRNVEGETTTLVVVAPVRSVGGYSASKRKISGCIRRQKVSTAPFLIGGHEDLSSQSGDVSFQLGYLERCFYSLEGTATLLAVVRGMFLAFNKHFSGCWNFFSTQPRS